MNAAMPVSRMLIASAVLLALAACATAETRPAGAAAVRAKLTQLQSDPQLATRAPVAIKDAEAAVRAAELPTGDRNLGHHRVTLADRKVEIASAQALTRFAEDQRRTLAEQRESARLDARTREADIARNDAAVARTEADAARMDATIAQQQSADLHQQSAGLQQQIAELNARSTDRGLVVTLGDVLFATGGSTLKGGSPEDLDRLAAFLARYPERTVVIEGHTDSVGSAASNLGLSQRRADAVKAYLVAQGVASARLSAVGLGAGSPAADNDTASGRQQNRRVEVIIANTVATRQ